MTVRVGVIGTGMIGADHVARLTTQVVGSRVSAVFDVATDRAAQVAAAAGATSHTSWEAVVAADDVDAVLIASPGHLHPEQAIACIAAGKPVLCEKPLATTSADALRVLEAEAAAGRRYVQLGFMRRYDAGYLDVKRTMTDGVIGEPLLAHAIHRNATVPDFFRGEMSLTDSLVHEFDVFRWLFDTEIESVTVLPVRTSPLAADGMRDPQVAVLRMAGGQVVTVESFVNCQYGYDVRCEVVGSLGTVGLDNPRTTVVITAGRRSESVPADWQERFAPAYTVELQSWVDDLAAGRVGGPSTWDGYAATAVAEAAVQSYAEGRPVDVRLAERPALYTAGE
ncbi:Gfo/Idh/MocA family protein [Kineosporia sp. R_H_3]|uniref:Gfo/Idh/MocA family protein n=1 Tax=Kineosporia sp. R_H_3 TaxID=1961848 RepID=UPI000B4B96DC|nr:Gfo/Idh/MocA family oxidoreductase [Kineosporia sp. R_H_3]